MQHDIIGLSGTMPTSVRQHICTTPAAVPQLPPPCSSSVLLWFVWHRAVQQTNAGLHELDSRFNYIQNVVKYCEEAYPAGDKADVSNRAEGYIVDALQAIAGDIEANAANLASMVALQAETLGSLDAKLGHVKFQLRLVGG